MQDNQDIQTLNKKTHFFLKERSPVHIKLKNNFFYNGLILEIAENEFLIIDDKMNGETPVFFSEILKIDRYREERE